MESRYDWMITPTPSPVELQIKTLGLAESLSWTRVLDIGCGRDALLVRYLREERGIDADGLDFRVPQTDYLIPFTMPKGIKMARERIPRPDNHYSLVVSHCMDDFYSSIYSPGSKEEESRNELEELVRENPSSHILRADFAILEALRVTQQGGKCIIYPALTLIGNMKLALEERNCHFEQQELDEKLKQELRTNADKLDLNWFKCRVLTGDIYGRTVIYKK